MKLIFEAPAIEIHIFLSEDILTTSGPQTASEKLTSGALAGVDNVSTAGWSDMLAFE